MSHPRQLVSIRANPIHYPPRGFGQRHAPLANHRSTFADQLHAKRTSAAMIVADRQNARRNRSRQRFPIPRRRQPRRSARGRTRPVIRTRRKNRIEQSPLTGLWQPLAMQEKNSVGKRRALHQLRDVIPTNPDRGLVRPNDPRAPRFPQDPIINSIGTGIVR
jgi:hypothetical protein